MKGGGSFVEHDNIACGEPGGSFKFSANIYGMGGILMEFYVLYFMSIYTSTHTHTHTHTHTQNPIFSLSIK